LTLRRASKGSQFTSGAWIDVLTDAKIKISMDGKGAWRDNRMIERLWRSLKYECVYLNAFETIKQPEVWKFC
jgi:putative transposase